MPHKRAKRSVRDAETFLKGNNLPPPAPGQDFQFDMPKGAMRILNAGKVQAEYNKRKRQPAEDTGPAQRGGPTAAQKGKGKAKAEAKNDSNAELKIRPGEKLGDFNRRVEQALAPGINNAMRTESRASAKAKRKRPHVSRTDEAEGSADAQADAGRKARADKAAALQASEPSAADLKREREGLQARARGGAEEWAKASQRRSVNDVAQAPPTFTKLPRGASAEALARKAAARAALLGEDPEEAARETKKRKDANVSAAQRQALQEERERVVKKYRQLKEGKIREREEREAVKKGGRRKAAGGNDE